MTRTETSTAAARGAVERPMPSGRGATPVESDPRTATLPEASRHSPAWRRHVLSLSLMVCALGGSSCIGPQSGEPAAPNGIFERMRDAIHGGKANSAQAWADRAADARADGDDVKAGMYDKYSHAEARAGVTEVRQFVNARGRRGRGRWSR